MATTTCLFEPALPGVAPTPSRWRVLLAEDDPINQKVVVAILERHGHSIMVAANGREAIAAFAREPFTLVLMDMEMPEMDGLEATAEIRARERLTGGHVPILAVTTCTSQEDRERCRAAGMDGHLAKPVQAQTLMPAITHLLQGNLTANGRTEHAPDDVFDQAGVLERVDGNLDLLREIIVMFAEDCPRLMNEMWAGIQAGDSGRVKLAAHTLRGAAGNFGAARAQDAAAALEAMGRSGSLAGAGQAFTVLQEAVHCLQPALNQLWTTPLGSEA